MTTLLQAVAEVARLTGQVALAHFRTRLDVETKRDGSPVTVADRAAEQAARAWIAARFPNDAILGEEFGADGDETARRWIIDPIDGTKTFVRGVPLWGTLIGVAQGEDVLAGAVYCPAVDEMVVAASAKGAGGTARARAFPAVPDLARSTVLVDRRPVRRTHPERASRWAALASEAAVARTWGDCYGYLLVATGRAEVMVDNLMSPWDAAALVPVVREAGGEFSDWDGRVTPFGDGAMATNGIAGRTASRATRRTVARREPVAATRRATRRCLTWQRSTSTRSISRRAEDRCRSSCRTRSSGAVLMTAFADREALERTIATGEMHFRSRSRGLWHKGATSGNTQRVVSLEADCDGDAVLARVIPAGPACHTGTASCFRDDVAGIATRSPSSTRPSPRVSRRVATAAGPSATSSYTRRLATDRNLRLKKLGEECAELVDGVRRRRSQSRDRRSGRPALSHARRAALRWRVAQRRPARACARRRDVTPSGRDRANQNPSSARADSRSESPT